MLLMLIDKGGLMTQRSIICYNQVRTGCSYPGQSGVPRGLPGGDSTLHTFQEQPIDVHLIK